MEVALSLDHSGHQGWYGEHFVHVLAAAAGLEADKKSLDRSGVDVCIGYPDELAGGRRYPTIEAQIKSWRSPAPATGPNWRYPELTEKHFSSLAGAGFQVPRFLFLVIVPKNVGDYAVAAADHLQLSHACYWVSLERHQPLSSPSATTKVPVEVPKSNLLTVNALLGLLDPALAGVP